MLVSSIWDLKVQRFQSMITLRMMLINSFEAEDEDQIYQ